MILCRPCKRLWPSGTSYCGTCGGSLGQRFCPEGHRNPLRASACTACGSRKLSRGVPSTNLRPFSFVALGVLAWGILRFVLMPLGAVLALRVWEAAMAFMVPLVTLAFWSFILSVFLNERGRAMIADFWSNVLQLSFRLAEALFRRLTPKKAKPKKE